MIAYQKFHVESEKEERLSFNILTTRVYWKHNEYNQNVVASQHNQRKFERK